MRHLTYTGAEAGTYLCLRFRATLGQGTSGEKVPGDTASHFVYTSDEVIASDNTCAGCRHVARCDFDIPCTICEELGYA